jgi:hypothetical protein
MSEIKINNDEVNKVLRDKIKFEGDLCLKNCFYREYSCVIDDYICEFTNEYVEIKRTDACLKCFS